MRKEISKKYVSTLALIGSVCSTQVSAMPYYRQDEALKRLDAAAIAQDSVLSGTSIFSDHLDSKKLLYVSPSSKKAQTGLYQIHTTPVCQILANQYALTYLVPQEPVTSWSEVAKRGPLSPYFDAQFGNYIRQQKILVELSQKIADIESAREAHPEEVREYEEALAVYESAKAERDRYQGELESYPKRIAAATAQLAVVTEAEALQIIRDQIKDIQAELVEQRPLLAQSIAKSTSAYLKAEERYLKARGVYGSLIPDEAKLTARITTLSELFGAFQKTSYDNFQLNSKTLLELESAGVGRATASYSIWGDEEARLRQVLQASGSDYAVARLPIYNVHLNPVQGHKQGNSFASDAGASGNGMNNASAIALANNVGGPVSTGEGMGLPLFVNSGGQTVVPKIDALTSDGAGTYQNLVTRGTYCTGSSARAFTDVNPEAEIFGDGRDRPFHMEVGRYESRQSNILAQTVSLEYGYNLKNDPVAVECTLNVEKISSYFSKKKTSGFLFWRRSSARMDRSLVQEMGVECKVDNNGFGPEAIKNTDAIRDKLEKEVVADYILQNAKSWEVSTASEAELPNPGAAAREMGTAVQSLCGANIYCQVGAIVLKNGNELFGSARGSTSGTDVVRGTYTRKYSEFSYSATKGQANIELTVAL